MDPLMLSHFKKTKPFTNLEKEKDSTFAKSNKKRKEILEEIGHKATDWNEFLGKKMDKKQAFLEEYLMPSMLIKTLKTRNIINPIFLPRTSKISKSQLLKRKARNALKRKCYDVEDILSIISFKKVKSSFLRNMKKRLNVSLHNMKLDSSHMGFNQQETVVIKATLEHDSDKLDTQIQEIPVSANFGKIKTCSACDLFTFSHDFFEYQEKYSGCGNDRWNVRIKIPRTDCEKEEKETRRSLRHSFQENQESVSHTVLVRLKDPNRKIRLEGMVEEPIISGKTGQVIGNMKLCLKWKYDVIGSEDVDDVTEKKNVDNFTDLDCLINQKDAKFHFRYIYANYSLCQKEVRTNFNCPWCGFLCCSLNDLFRHLVATHDQFEFSLKEENCIDVIVKKKKPTTLNLKGISTPFGRIKKKVNNENECEYIDDDNQFFGDFVYVNPKRRVKRVNCEKIERTKNEYSPSGENETGNQEEKDAAEDEEISIPVGQFFHGSTCQPLQIHELAFEDSDHDVDEEWLVNQSDKLIDEFDDVSHSEKEFMKMWNKFIRGNKVYADYLFPEACLMFVQQFGNEILEKKLKERLILHLISMWEWNLIDIKSMGKCMKFFPSEAFITDDKADE